MYDRISGGGGWGWWCHKCANGWYLEYHQDEEVYVGHPQELLKEVQRYEGENVVL